MDMPINFAGTDEMIDQLAEFLKMERVCCTFFIFKMLISGGKKEAWLRITGPVGAKDFIRSELAL